MKEEKTICHLFDKLRPVITAKLLNPDDYYVRMGAVQLVVPLDAGETREALVPVPTGSPNIWRVYPDEPIDLPWATWEAWQTQLVISLRSDHGQQYELTVSLISRGGGSVASYGQTVTGGTLAQVAQAVKSDRFPARAAEVFGQCREAVGLKMLESERQQSVDRKFAQTDITDYDSVMRFVDFLKDRTVLESRGHGIELFEYNRVVLLLDRASKSVKVLVDRDGRARFCRLEDFPASLFGMIRQSNPGWDLGVYHLTVGMYNSRGVAFVTWVISPYFYCPMDEDGFGEEEEYEVAVTCHIDTAGRLVGAPAWKPYTGPRR